MVYESDNGGQEQYYYGWKHDIVRKTLCAISRILYVPFEISDYAYNFVLSSFDYSGPVNSVLYSLHDSY